MNYTLHHGDCLDILRTLPDNSVDAIVTDPPYGLSFMGKRWDYDVPSEDIWRECLRVLKPGGHLLAFAGTRTQHRMAVRIEDAGFEIRDMIAWVYSSGFPKSLDVSKAIDKGHGENRERQLQFTAWMRSTGLSASAVRDILYNAGSITEKSNQASHYFAETIGSQPAIATADMFDKLRPYLPEVPEYIERLVCERTGLEWTAYKQREVVGQGWRVDRKEGAVNYGGGTPDGAYNITAPATPAAHQWQGWGTALKPALEPITVARKPLIGTVAENVLTWGTGGVNVDGCRVEASNGRPLIESKSEESLHAFGNGLNGSRNAGTTTLGRWPANLIHDGSEEATELCGDAARFFYCAKASKRDRDEGCEGMPLAGGHLASDQGGGGGWKADAKDNPNLPRANHHPTVKPTDLMRYLCRLVTPPNGIVLDPFMGSGSTGKAAVLEGFAFIGIEREAEYLDIARARIEYVMAPDFEQTDEQRNEPTELSQQLTLW